MLYLGIEPRILPESGVFLFNSQKLSNPGGKRAIHQSTEVAHHCSNLRLYGYTWQIDSVTGLRTGLVQDANRRNFLLYLSKNKEYRLVDQQR